MPHDERAACGFGAFGGCCCECRFQAVLRPPFGAVATEADGLLGKVANAASESYACTYFYMYDNKAPIVMSRLHGMCEGFEKKGSAKPDDPPVSYSLAPGV